MHACSEANDGEISLYEGVFNIGIPVGEAIPITYAGSDANAKPLPMKIDDTNNIKVDIAAQSLERLNTALTQVGHWFVEGPNLPVDLTAISGRVVPAVGVIPVDVRTISAPPKGPRLPIDIQAVNGLNGASMSNGTLPIVGNVTLAGVSAGVKVPTTIDPSTKLTVIPDVVDTGKFRPFPVVQFTQTQSSGSMFDASTYSEVGIKHPIPVLPLIVTDGVMALDAVSANFTNEGTGLNNTTGVIIPQPALTGHFTEYTIMATTGQNDPSRGAAQRVHQV